MPFRSCDSPKWRRDLDQADEGVKDLLLLQRLLDLLGLERLDHVADLHVLVALEHDPALEALGDLLDVVLEASERAHAPGPDHRALPNEADLGDARDLPVGDLAAGDVPPARP